MNRSAAVLWAFLGALLALPFPVAAQIQYGSLRGTITDSNGGAIPEVQVVAVAAETQTNYTAVTNSQGAYAIISMPLGTYTLTAAKAGFQTTTQIGITMAAGEQKSIDLQLKVGSASVSVQVTGAAPALETDTGAYSETVDQKTLIQLPLEMTGLRRQATAYLQALPGFQNGAGFDNQINGSVDTYSEIYVDGTPLEGNAAARGLVRGGFSPEAVAEQKVVQTPMADTGNTGGNAISYILTSGTNQLHGSAFIYQRNTAFDSRCEFCTTTAADHQGEYGFEIGGPVYIPKFYDGRNKTFWWFNWGWYHNVSGAAPTIFSFPTALWKAGNFSDLLGAQIGTDALGRPVLSGQLYNPYSTRILPSGTILRDPFPGNIIPAALFSSVSSKYQAFFPEPNIAGDINNYLSPEGLSTYPDRFYEIDLDHTIRTKDHLTLAYWTDHNPFVQEVTQVPAPLATGVYFATFGHNEHMNWTHTFSPTLVNTASFGFDRFQDPSGPSHENAAGAAAVGQPHPYGSCLPGINVSNLTGPSSGAGCGATEGDNNFAINDNWTKDAGKHLIKWGFNLIRFNANFPAGFNMVATFLAGQTALPGQPNCADCADNTGAAYASFLLGATQAGIGRGNQYSSPRLLDYGFYGQDQFKLTPKLTVIFGLRYDVAPFPVEVNNRVSQWDETLPNAAAGNLPGALTFLGYGAGRLNKRHVTPNEYWNHNFGPKLSFAYQIFPNTVLRAAYTVSYGPANQIEQGFAGEYQQGFFPYYTVTSTNGINPAFYWDSGFPFPQGVPVYNNFDPTSYNGSSTGYFGKTADQSGRIQNIHVDIQYQLPGRVVVAANYNGTVGHGILLSSHEPRNQLDYSKYGSLGTLLTDDISSTAARAANIPIPYPGFSGTVATALSPFPQYQDIENQGVPLGSTTYNAAQFTAQKQFSNDLSFFIGYTVSKQLSNYAGTTGFTNEPQNAYDLKAEKALYYTNIPQQVLLNYTYALPVGRGKRLNIDNRALDAVAGGWSVAGVQTYQSGFPMAVVTQQTLPTVYAPIRPNVVPGVPVRSGVSCGNFNPSTDVYLNSAAFTDPAPFTFGNSSVTLPHTFTCPLLSENITGFKTFKIREGFTFKIGADFFNPFNRHQWGAPNVDIDSPGYGTITSQANTPRSIQINGRLSF